MKTIAAQNSQNERMVLELIRTQADLTPLLDGLSAKPAAIKFGSAKVLKILSERDPALVYAYFDRIAAFLDSENHILQWNTIRVLANLASVDRKGRFRALLEKYYGLIPGPDMIAAAEVIRSSPKIARAFPGLADTIKDQILKVQTARYKTPECRNVVIGHALTALEGMYDLIADRKAVRSFLKRQLNNPRRPVAVKAGKVLTRLQKTLPRTLPQTLSPVRGKVSGKVANRKYAI